MKSKILPILSIGLAAFLTSHANATVFSGSATGVFGETATNPITISPYQGHVGGPDGFYATGDPEPAGDEDIYYIQNNDDGGVASFTWGLPYAISGSTQTLPTGTLSNSFVFDGDGSDADPTGDPPIAYPQMNTDDPLTNPFRLGVFDYYNGDTFYSWGIEGVTLDIEFYIENRHQDQVAGFNMVFDFEIENVTNYPDSDPYDGDTWVNTPDIIHLLNNRTWAETFWSEGKQYELNVLGFYDTMTHQYSYDFSSPESTRSQAELYAEINEVPVPEPGTMLLFGVGLVGLIGISLRRKKVNTKTIG